MAILVGIIALLILLDIAAHLGGADSRDSLNHPGQGSYQNW